MLKCFACASKLPLRVSGHVCATLEFALHFHSAAEDRFQPDQPAPQSQHRGDDFLWTRKNSLKFLLSTWKALHWTTKKQQAQKSEPLCAPRNPWCYTKVSLEDLESRLGKKNIECINSWNYGVWISQCSTKYIDSIAVLVVATFSFYIWDSVLFFLIISGTLVFLEFWRSADCRVDIGRFCGFFSLLFFNCWADGNAGVWRRLLFWYSWYESLDLLPLLSHKRKIMKLQSWLKSLDFLILQGLVIKWILWISIFCYISFAIFFTKIRFWLRYFHWSLLDHFICIWFMRIK